MLLHSPSLCSTGSFSRRFRGSIVPEQLYQKLRPSQGKWNPGWQCAHCADIFILRGSPCWQLCIRAMDCAKQPCLHPQRETEGMTEKERRMKSIKWTGVKGPTFSFWVFCIHISSGLRALSGLLGLSVLAVSSADCRAWKGEKETEYERGRGGGSEQRKKGVKINCLSIQLICSLKKIIFFYKNKWLL